MVYTDMDIAKVCTEIASMPYAKLIGVKYQSEILDMINSVEIKDFLMDVSLSIDNDERTFIKERINGYRESVEEFNIMDMELGKGTSVTDITIALVYIKHNIENYEKIIK